MVRASGAIGLASLVALAGCGLIWGFADSTLATEAAPCSSSSTGSSYAQGTCGEGFVCARGQCRRPCTSHAQCGAGFSCRGDSDPFVDGSVGTHCLPNSAPCEGGACEDGGAGERVLATFTGLPGSVVAYDGNVYFSHDSVIEGCSIADTCRGAPSLVSPFDAREPSALGTSQHRLVWTDAVLANGAVTACATQKLERCTLTTSFRPEPGARGIAVDPSGDVYWLATQAPGGTDVRVSRSLLQPTTVASLPFTGFVVALASDGPGRIFVAAGRQFYSIGRPTDPDAGPETAVVEQLNAAGSAIPRSVAVAVTAKRVIWTRPADLGGGLSQCRLRDGEIRPCDPAAIGQLEAGEEVTALHVHGTSLYYGVQRGASSEIVRCVVSGNPDPLLGCEARTVIVSGIAGRVGSIAVFDERNSIVPPTLYFMADTISPSDSGRVRVERRPL